MDEEDIYGHFDVGKKENYSRSFSTESPASTPYTENHQNSEEKLSGE